MVSNLDFESSYLSSYLGPQNKKRVQKSYAVELQIIGNYAVKSVLSCLPQLIQAVLFLSKFLILINDTSYSYMVL